MGYGTPRGYWKRRRFAEKRQNPRAEISLSGCHATGSDSGGCFRHLRETKGCMSEVAAAFGYRFIIKVAEGGLTAFFILHDLSSSSVFFKMFLPNLTCYRQPMAKRE